MTEMLNLRSLRLKEVLNPWCLRLKNLIAVSLLCFTVINSHILVRELPILDGECSQCYPCYRFYASLLYTLPSSSLSNPD